MYYEDVTIGRGDTISKLAGAYGYKVSDWQRVWNDSRNSALVGRRRAPESIQPGDILSIRIPWHVTTKRITKEARGASIVLDRDGELGERISWVQTVYQHNQPVAGTTAFCVDGCPADDDLPFYWTNLEIAGNSKLRTSFSDYSQRNPPSAVQGTTKWRAVVSLAVITGKRVTVYGSLVWGWDMTPANAIVTVGPRAATSHEIAGHLHLLRVGRGLSPGTFGSGGWTFRTAP